ncbi:MAG: alpha/beta hydrolase [Halobacteriota archaeon]
MSADDPHAGAEVLTAGADLADAHGAVVALHGRGAVAAGMLDLLAEADPTDGRLAHLAPQAAGRTWYPRPFLAPTAANEPHLASALATVDRVVERTTAAVGRDRTVLVGFSQGACLASEYVARNTARYGGLVALSGGLIGETVDHDRYGDDLEGTPAYLGCSDVDPHIPVERVRETADALERLGAEVAMQLFPDMGHQVNHEELAAMRDRLRAVAEA